MIVPMLKIMYQKDFVSDFDLVKHGFDPDTDIENNAVFQIALISKEWEQVAKKLDSPYQMNLH